MVNKMPRTGTLRLDFASVRRPRLGERPPSARRFAQLLSALKLTDLSRVEQRNDNSFFTLHDVAGGAEKIGPELEFHLPASRPSGAIGLVERYPSLRKKIFALDLNPPGSFANSLVGASVNNAVGVEIPNYIIRRKVIAGHATPAQASSSSSSSSKTSPLPPSSSSSPPPHASSSSSASAYSSSSSSSF